MEISGLAGESTMKTGACSEIEKIIRPAVESEGLELVEIEYKKGLKQFLRIFIDKPGGVTHSDCAKISSQVGDLLEIEDVIENNYILEVSSPGLDRPLLTESDYKRNVGELVKIFLNVPFEGEKVVVGKISNAQHNKVVLKEKSNKVVNIPISNILKGKLVIDF